jgi:hypothetical protein
MYEGDSFPNDFLLPCRPTPICTTNIECPQTESSGFPNESYYQKFHLPMALDSYLYGCTLVT